MFTPKKHIYTDVDTFLTHVDFNGTQQITPQMTSQLTHHFTLHQDIMDITWHITFDGEQMTDDLTSYGYSKTTQKAESTHLLSYPSEILSNYLRMVQIPTTHNNSVK